MRSYLRRLALSLLVVGGVGCEDDETGSGWFDGAASGVPAARATGVDVVWEKHFHDGSFEGVTVAKGRSDDVWIGGTARHDAALPAWERPLLSLTCRRQTMFLLHLDANGSVLSSMNRCIEQDGIGLHEGFGIAVADDGRVVLAGNAYALDDAPGPSGGVGDPIGFVSAYAADGTQLWHREVSGAGRKSGFVPSLRVRMGGATMSSDNRVVVAGVFYGAYAFGSDPLPMPAPDQAGEMFVATLDAAGTVLDRYALPMGASRLTNFAPHPDGSFTVAGRYEVTPPSFLGQTSLPAVDGYSVSGGWFFAAVDAAHAPTRILGGLDRSALGVLAVGEDLVFAGGDITGAGIVWSVAPDGTQRWATQLGASAYGLQLLANGDIAGAFDDYLVGAGLFVLDGRTGAVRWQRAYDRARYANGFSMQVDSTGALLAAGVTNPGGALTIAKMAPPR